MFRKSRFRHSISSSSHLISGWLLGGLVGFLLLQVLMFGMFIPSLPSLRTSMETMIPMNSTLYSTAVYIKSDTATMENCLSFGCPINPPELDDVLNDLSQLERNKYLNFPYGTRRMAMLTKKSNRHNPPINQDSLVLVDPFQTLWTSLYDSFFLAGIFDGHGDDGHLVSRHVARDLPNRLALKLNELFHLPNTKKLTDEAVIQALKDTFVDVDVNLPPTAMNGGCTASVTLRIGSKLYIANTGDSRTIVVSEDLTNTTTIVYMSRLDKGHLTDELKRIQGLGGHVHIPSQHPEFSRVVVYSKFLHEQVGLAMSRSIGDWEWKAIGVIAEPIVDIINLANISKNSFLLTASDGMWDMRRPIFFAYRFAESFFRPKGKHPLLACHQVIKAASPLDQTEYRDDITVLAVKL